jgi:hypothetical protein
MTLTTCLVKATSPSRLIPTHKSHHFLGLLPDVLFTMAYAVKSFAKILGSLRTLTPDQDRRSSSLAEPHVRPPEHEVRRRDASLAKLILDSASHQPAQRRSLSSLGPT